jgi:hypothetical protein
LHKFSECGHGSPEHLEASPKFAGNGGLGMSIIYTKNNKLMKKIPKRWEIGFFFKNT